MQSSYIQQNLRRNNLSNINHKKSFACVSPWVRTETESLRHRQPLIPAWRTGDPVMLEMLESLVCARLSRLSRFVCKNYICTLTQQHSPLCHRQPIDVSHWLFLLIFGVLNNRWSTAFLPVSDDRNVKCSQLCLRLCLIYYLYDSAFGIFIRLFWPVNPSFKCCSHPAKCSVKKLDGCKACTPFLGLVNRRAHDIQSGSISPKAH